jgi:hypothetical protein
LFLRFFERLIDVGVTGRYDSSLVAALAELLMLIWANHVFPFFLMFDTGVKGWLVLADCISSVE